jgi:CheY-like chemotaxis protein
MSGRLSILLVEDNADMRQSVTEMLETVGYSVSSAAEPRAALSLFEREPSGIDLLISDVVLPGMNGKAMADRMRESAPELKVLFISGYAEDIVTAEDLRERYENLLRKPFSMDQLLDAIDRLAEGAPSPKA